MKSLLVLSLHLALLVSHHSAVQATNIAKAVWLPEAAKQGAVCLDGSPPLYYIRPGSATNASKFVFHIQGGGWCMSYDSCLSRTQTYLGSSDRHFQPCKSPTGDCYVDLNEVQGCNDTRWCGTPMVNDSAVNPMMHDWTAVLIMYCDGGSFTGSNSTSTFLNGTQLHFQGARVLSAIIDDLVANHGLGAATHAVIGGDSAGGQATYLHIDSIRAKLPSDAHVVGAPDSGFFMPVGYYGSGLQWVYEAMNSSFSLNPQCLAAHAASGDQYKCIYVEVAAPYVRTPLFAIQSQYDPAQPMESQDPDYVTHYGHVLLDTLLATVIDGRPNNAAALYSCYQHCGGWQFVINGTTATHALQAFFTGATTQRVWLQNASYPCSSCCAKEL